MRMHCLQVSSDEPRLLTTYSQLLIHSILIPPEEEEDIFIRMPVNAPQSSNLQMRILQHETPRPCTAQSRGQHLDRGYAQHAMSRAIVRPAPVAHV